MSRNWQRRQDQRRDAANIRELAKRDPREVYPDRDPDKVCPECQEPLWLKDGKLYEADPYWDTFRLRYHICPAND